MSKGNTTENDLVLFYFNNVAMPTYGSNITLNLHTADPGETGTASTNVATYTSYASVNVSRDSGGWSVSNGGATNVALIQFPKCTGAGDNQTITHLSMSNSTMFMSGALVSPLVVTNNIQPQFNIGMITYTED